jgi:hypothetical protein
MKQSDFQTDPDYRMSDKAASPKYDAELRSIKEFGDTPQAVEIAAE